MIDDHDGQTKRVVPTEVRNAASIPPLDRPGLEFVAWPSGLGTEPAVFDPGTGVLWLLGEVNPSPAGYGSDPSHFVVGPSGWLYFTADDGTTGVEMWGLYPTTRRLVLVADLAPWLSPDTRDSYPGNYVAGPDGVVYFTAFGHTGFGSLWSFDPEIGATAMLHEVAGGAEDTSISGPKLASGGLVVFEGVYGTWASLQTYDPATGEVNDLGSGLWQTNSSNGLRGWAVSGNSVYYTLVPEEAGPPELSRTDVVSGETVAVAVPDGGFAWDPVSVEADGRIRFEQRDLEHNSLGQWLLDPSTGKWNRSGC